MQGWTLTPDSFNKLLTLLGSKGADAGQEYERIRRRLIRFFEWQLCNDDPEALADESINRVAKALDEGKEVWSKDPLSFFYGVARNVLKEDRRRKETVVLEPLTWAPDPSAQVITFPLEPSQDEDLSCLDTCADDLAQSDRDLIIGYYFGEKAAKIQQRKELARQLDITMNALRIRAHRIRTELETCVAGCVERRATS